MHRYLEIIKNSELIVSTSQERTEFFKNMFPSKHVVSLHENISPLEEAIQLVRSQDWDSSVKIAIDRFRYGTRIVSYLPKGATLILTPDIILDCEPNETIVSMLPSIKPTLLEFEKTGDEIAYLKSCAEVLTFNPIVRERLSCVSGRVPVFNEWRFPEEVLLRIVGMNLGDALDAIAPNKSDFIYTCVRLLVDTGLNIDLLTAVRGALCLSDPSSESLSCILFKDNLVLAGFDYGEWPDPLSYEGKILSSAIGNGVTVTHVKGGYIGLKPSGWGDIEFAEVRSVPHDITHTPPFLDTNYREETSPSSKLSGVSGEVGPYKLHEIELFASDPELFTNYVILRLKGEGGVRSAFRKVMTGQASLKDYEQDRQVYVSLYRRVSAVNLSLQDLQSLDLSMSVKCNFVHEGCSIDVLLDRVYRQGDNIVIVQYSDARILSWLCAIGAGGDEYKNSVVYTTTTQGLRRVKHVDCGNIWREFKERVFCAT